MEPFWPQGLGSNRGFHTAMDACHAISVLGASGLEPALLERSFAYDSMRTQPWFMGAGLLDPHGWSADPLTRYPEEWLTTMAKTYKNPKAKRSNKGADAVPPRVLALL